MGRIGSLPSVPDEYVEDVASTSWALGAKERDLSLASPVSSVMRYATPIAASTPLTAVVELLAEPARRLLTVVDAEHRPLGVLTSSDLLTAVRGRTREELAVMTALDAATWGGPYLPEFLPIEAVARELVRDDREFALIVDVRGGLLGVVMAIDVLATL